MGKRHPHPLLTWIKKILGLPRKFFGIFLFLTLLMNSFLMETNPELTSRRQSSPIELGPPWPNWNRENARFFVAVRTINVARSLTKKTVSE